MGRLKAANIIMVLKQKESTYYEIGMDRSILQDLLFKDKTDFTEKIVDDYVDMVNEF